MEGTKHQSSLTEPRRALKEAAASLPHIVASRLPIVM